MLISERVCDTLCVHAHAKDKCQLYGIRYHGYEWMARTLPTGRGGRYNKSLTPPAMPKLEM